ncbi:condensation domain protein [Kribbella flavida DSM 17836]|uniref:Condensation domain protein n=1 Tax=Kribbella flavida (strain DSM 17836 / JCM 10339 / NBRC 14399) TaxID=479435 RepID=D2PSM1_KRIFD|nr:condensation domain-containing protein [Kribbella flavida]ADB33159.1 condensation domain protein [Kribbella flavida DSM 17836]
MYPLSFGQEQLWLVDQLLGPAALAAPALSVRVTGPLDVPALRRSFAEVTARHAVLRSTFHFGGETCVQEVDHDAEPDFDLVDLAGDPGQVRSTCVDEVRRGFDLTRDRPVRVRVYRLSEHDHVLLVVRHHIVWDAESGAVFARELEALYRQAVTGDGPTLPALSLQYGEIAQRLRDELSGERLDSLLAKAREAVGEPPPVPLSNRSGSAGGGLQRLQLPDEVVDRVLDVARSCRLTPYIVFAALFRSWWAGAVGVPAVLLGTPVSARTRPEYQDLIGYFVNLVVSRVDVSDAVTVRELLAQERAAVLGTLATRDLPYELLARSYGRSADDPLLQVSLTFQQAELPALDLPGLQTSVFDLEAPGLPTLPLMVAIGRTETGMLMEWAHREADDAELVQQLAAGFAAGLGPALSDLDRRVDELPWTPVELPDALRPDRDVPTVTWLEQDAGAPPTTMLEKELAAAWSGLLGLEVEGVEMSFFGLGGHSLLVAKLAVRLSELFGAPVRIADLMERPTIAAQAVLVEELLEAQVASLDVDEVDRLAQELAARETR